jgi:putative transposase
LPFKRLIEIIKYNCEEAGIIVLLKEESYTSGTSFLDNEEPNKINYNKNRRIKRGLFETNKGIKINSDINASLQILKKHIGNYYYTLLNILNPIKIKLKY